MPDQIVQIVIEGVDDYTPIAHRTAKATQELGAAAEATRGHMDSMGKVGGQALGKLSAQFTDLAKTALSFAAGGAMLTFTASLAQHAQEAMDSIANLGRETLKLERETGATAEQVSGLIAVFGRFGVEADQASTALRIFSKHMNGLQDLSETAIIGGKGFAGVMRQIGVEFLDASGKARPMYEVLLEVADRFHDMRDGVEKTGLALEMFGRTGTRMIPVLNQGRDGMEAAMKTAKEMGLVLGQDDVNAVLKFTMAQKDLGEALKGAEVQIGKEVLPQLTQLVQLLSYSAHGWMLLGQRVSETGRQLSGTLSPALAEAADKTTKAGKAYFYLDDEVKHASVALVAFDDDVKQATVLMPAAEAEALRLARAYEAVERANRHMAQQIVDRANAEGHGIETERQATAQAITEHRSMLGLSAAFHDTGSEVLTLSAQMKELHQVNDVYGSSSEQSRALLAKMAPAVNQLRQNYGSLTDMTDAQKESIAALSHEYQGQVDTLNRIDLSAAKAETAAVTKEFRDDVGGVRQDMAQLHSVTALYGASSEQAQAITAKLGADLGELKGRYGSLTEAQQQEVSTLDLEYQRLLRASSSFDTLKKMLSEVLSALVALNPATLAAAAAVQMWQGRIESVNLALRANQDQLKAAQSELTHMSEHLSELNKQLSEAKQRLTDFTAPQLTGMGALEDHMETVQALLNRMDLAKKMGEPFAQILRQYPLLTDAAKAYAATLPTTEEGLKRLLEQMQAQKKVSFDEQLASLAEAAKTKGPEISYSAALSGIAATKSQISGLTGAIAAQEAAMRAQKGVIESIQQASEALNRTLQEYQEQLKGAEARQKLVGEALQMGYKWLLEDRTKFTELGAEGTRVASVMDVKARALLTAVTSAAEGTNAISSEALADMVKNFQADTSRAVLSVTGTGGLVPSLAKIAPPIAEGIDLTHQLKGAIDALGDKTVTITTVHRDVFESVGGAAVPGFQHGVRDFRGGLALVGEAGPELVRLPRGSDVIPSGRAGGGAGGTTIIVQLNAPVYGFSSFEDAVVKAVETGQRRGRI